MSAVRSGLGRSGLAPHLTLPRLRGRERERERAALRRGGAGRRRSAQRPPNCPAAETSSSGRAARALRYRPYRDQTPPPARQAAPPSRIPPPARPAPPPSAPPAPPPHKV